MLREGLPLPPGADEGDRTPPDYPRPLDKWDRSAAVRLDQDWGQLCTPQLA